MPSNEGHIHWMGSDSESIGYLGQQLEIVTGYSEDPEGALRIRALGSTEPGVFLPNSTPESPQWDAIPGTSPILEVHQDGHYTGGFIRIRQA